MANDEQLVIDIIVNGKQAQVTLDQVKKETDQVGDKATGASKKVDKATGNITRAWKVVRTSLLAVVGAVAAASAATGLMVKSSLELSKTTFGLTDSMKSWITVQAAATGMNEKMIASFVRTGKSAGMADATTKDMIDSALALSRAFPEESIETFIDNLVMLNTSGEAQGYIVDVMEQKWGTLDLKGKSLAEKLELIAGVTAGVNKKFDDTAGAKMDKVFNRVQIAARKLGTTLVTLVEKWGWLDDANSALDKLLRSMKTIDEMSLKEAEAELQELGAEIIALGAHTPEFSWLEKALGRNAKTVQDAIKKKIEEYNILKEVIKKKTDEAVVEAAAAKVAQKATNKRIAQVQERLQAEKDAAQEKKDLDRGGAEFAKSIIDKKMSNAILFAKLEKDLDRGGAEFAKSIIDEKTANAILFAETQKKLADEVAAKQKILDDEQSQRVTVASNHMANSFIEMAKTGKASFKDMAEAIITDIARMILQQQIFLALKAATAAMSGGISSLFHTGTDEVKHSGGIIGGIPAHHSGSTRSDERIARLQVGEAVVNRAGASRNKGAISQMNAGQKVGGQAIQQTTAEITFNVQAIDSASFNNYLVGNRQTIEGIINKSLSTNGSVRQTIKQVV